MPIHMQWFSRLRRTKVYRPRMHNTLPKRLNWEQIEKRPRQEGSGVVKGTSKRVIVVKSPDPKIFEQAIFIVKEDYRRKGGTNAGEVLREAQKVADDYVRSSVAGRGRIWKRLSPYLLPLAGAVLGAVVYLTLRYIGA